jgi:hypothetical protein
MNGLIETVETLVWISVYPSGAARATSYIAMMHAAPPRLSITNGWPSVSPSRFA